MTRSAGFAIEGQADLFGHEARTPALAYRDEIVSPAEEAALIRAIDGQNLNPFRFQQWTGKRLTHSFGWRYDLETRVFGPADPIPAWLLPVRERAARFVGLSPADFVQALLIRYDEGAGIGWHKDRPVFEHVAGVSLGARADMRFRRRLAGKYARFSATLAPRSIYHLSGEIRHEWEHSIAPMPQARWSISFRSLA